MATRWGHCIFCDIVHGAAEVSVCYEDTESIAFMDIQPVNAGHVLVVSRQHFESFHDLPRGLGAHLFDVAMQLAPAIRKCPAPTNERHRVERRGGGAGRLSLSHSSDPAPAGRRVRRAPPLRGLGDARPHGAGHDGGTDHWCLTRPRAEAANRSPGGGGSVTFLEVLAVENMTGGRAALLRPDAPHRIRTARGAAAQRAPAAPLHGGT